MKRYRPSGVRISVRALSGLVGTTGGKKKPYWRAVLSASANNGLRPHEPCQTLDALQGVPEWQLHSQHRRERWA
jgi:hypothetical protein